MNNNTTYNVDCLDAIDGMATTLFVATTMINAFPNLKDTSYWIASLDEQKDDVASKLGKKEIGSTDYIVYNNYKLTISRNLKKAQESGVPNILKSYYSFLDESYKTCIGDD